MGASLAVQEFQAGQALASPSRWSRWLLGGAFLTFFLGTAGLFFWGPWLYPIENGRGRLVVFLIAVHLAFAVGYARAIRGRPRPSRRPMSVNRLVLVASVVDLILLFPTSALNTGSWIPWPSLAMRDLAAAYTGSLSAREAGTPYVNYVRMFAAPLLALIVPLGVYYWHQLRRATQFLMAASVVGNIALFVAMGANAGAAQWMALFPWFVLAAHLTGLRPLDRRRVSWAAGVQAVSIGIFALLFTASMNQRTGSFAKHGVIPGINAQVSVTPGTVTTPPPSRPAAAVTSPAPVADASADAELRGAARVGAEGLAGYFTQGYYAVYLSLQEPFVPAYGVGNSVFLQRQVAKVLGSTDILQRSYPERIQARGWNSYGYWATIYPWIASDVTFPGTVVVFLLVGWLAGRVWLDAIGGGNVFAIAFLGQVLILLYYVPAHNKVMHSGEGVFAFWGLFAVWLATTRTSRHGQRTGQ